MACLKKGGANIWKHKDDPSPEEVEELNRMYPDYEWGEEFRRRDGWLRRLVKILALVIALTFLFTVTVRWLSYFFSTPWDLLERSRSLEEKELVEELQRSVVYLDAAGPGRAEYAGTGFNLHPEGMVVTNRHVIEDALTVAVSFKERGTHRVERWDKDEEVDVALLYLEGKDLPYLELSGEKPVAGEEVLIIGNPLQHRRIAVEGEIVDTVPRQNIMIIDAPVYPGHSGSPVFNSDGKVTGIIFASRETSQGETVGLAFTLEELQRLFPPD